MTLEYMIAEAKEECIAEGEASGRAAEKMESMNQHIYRRHFVCASGRVAQGINAKIKVSQQRGKRS